MLSQPSSRKIWFLSLLTLGLYFFYWCSRSRTDINTSAKQVLIPSTWYLAVPGLNYYWIWLYAGALQKVSFNRIKSTDLFLVYVLCMNVLTILVTLGRYFDFGFIHSQSVTQPSLHSILIVISILVATSTLINAAALGFFCNYAQKKINALPGLKQSLKA